MSSTNRVQRGGAFSATPIMLGAAYRVTAWTPGHDGSSLGFRIAAPVTAAPVPMLSPLTLLALCGLLGGLAGRRVRAA